MYNGIGLQTAKGSGTNGYVQRNLAHVRTQRVDFKDLKSLKAGIKVKKANPELILHEQKRKVELELLTLADELKSAGQDDAQIERTVSSKRQEMLRAVEDGSLRYESKLTDTHQLALEKEKELERFEQALGIDRNQVGGVFDQELQARLRMERMQARAEQERQRNEAAQVLNTVLPIPIRVSHSVRATDLHTATCGAATEHTKNETPVPVCSDDCHLHGTITFTASIFQAVLNRLACSTGA